MQSFDPIAAISTPYGRGGIAVIRMSGENSIYMAERLFVPKSGRKLSELSSATAVYGDIFKDGKRIDDGIATVYRAPHSYTGEDTVEISCHGGIIVTESVLTAAFEAGFRAAFGGEFTKRAFLNGKLSLSQAESVIGLIDAESEDQMKLASSHRTGVLSKKVDALCECLSDILASVYAYIDYPDEDLTDVSVNDLKDRLNTVYSELTGLCSSYKTGRAVSEGIKTVIVGKPNAGKSSLLNQLLGYDRAIVTAIPGTTRDTVEERAVIGRVLLRLCDTAGIRESDDEVEVLGIKRSISKLNDADLVIAVFDSETGIDSLDNEVISAVLATDAEVIAVVNKTDISFTDFDLPFTTFSVSAFTGEGIDELKKYISDLYVEEKLDYDRTAVIVNARQYSSASSAAEFLRNAISALNSGFTQDTAGMDIELALSKLKELDGKGVSEEITEKIFSRFCVGK